MKHIIVFLYFLASSTFLYAEEAKLMPEVVELLRDAPKLAQNLRRFDMLSMEITEEELVDGKWKLIESKKVLADFRRDIMRVKKVEENDKSSMRRYSDWTSNSQSGKETYLYADLDKKENNIVFPEKINEAYASIYAQKNTVSGICNDRLWRFFMGGGFFFFFDSSADRERTLLEIIQDPAYQNKGTFKIKRLDPNTTIVDFGVCRYFFDLSKGMPFKYVDRLSKIKDTLKDFSMEVTEFTLKDGRLFPTAILYRREGKPISRQKINPKTLKIDQPLSPSDFAVKIYPGTRVRDEIENKEYIAGQEMSSADIKELERQIINLVGEVQKHREKSKNEAKAKKEQQGKEKR
jgi:hypothetical protein